MDRLAQLLADLQGGKITLAEYQTKAAAILAEELAANRINQAEHDSKKAEVDAQKAPEGGGGGGLTLEEVQRMIQSETDKVRTAAAKEKKDLQDKLDELAKSKMSEEEKAKFEREKLESDLKQREADLQSREVSLHTVDQLRAKELPLDFRDILAGGTKEDTDKRIEVFAKQWADAIKAAVDARFKESGGNPNSGKGGGGGGTDNPWKAETLNLTKQAQILREDPERAKALKAAAGK